MVTALILPRMLGPGYYGDYKYLLYSFSQYTNFIGIGNNFLVTRLAQNHYDKNLISFYWIFILILGTLGAILLVPILSSGLYTIIFPGQELFYVWIAFFLALLLFIASILESMSDSCGLTTNASIINISTRIIGLTFLVLFFFVFDWKSFLSVFTWSYISTFLLIIGFVGILKKNNIPIFPSSISFTDFKQTLSAWYNYSHPMLVLALISHPISFLNRWMLQSFGGSVQQGFFALSDSLSSFVIAFSNSFVPLLMRELSISFKNQDAIRMSTLFSKSISFLFACSSYFSVFLLLNAAEATNLIGGRNFEGAILPVCIMILYPIPYTINNVLYAFIYSTNRTVLLRNVNGIYTIFNVFLTYLLLAPNKNYGLDLGAAGYAITMVLAAGSVYLILLKYCAASMNLSWTKIIGNHILVIALFSICGLLSGKLAELFTDHSIIAFFISGSLYSFGVFLVLLKFPKLLGISFSEIYSLVLPKPKPVEEV